MQIISNKQKKQVELPCLGQRLTTFVHDLIPEFQNNLQFLCFSRSKDIVKIDHIDEADFMKTSELNFTIMNPYEFARLIKEKVTVGKVIRKSGFADLFIEQDMTMGVAKLVMVHDDFIECLMTTKTVTEEVQAILLKQEQIDLWETIL